MKNIINTIKEGAKEIPKKAVAGIAAASIILGAGAYQKGYCQYNPFANPMDLYQNSQKVLEMWEREEEDKKLREKIEQEKRIRESQRQVQEKKDPSQMTLEEKYNSSDIDVFFSCKDWVDENNNELVEFNELKGINNYFKEGETFCNVALIKNKKGLVKENTINPKGNYTLDGKGKPLILTHKINNGDKVLFSLNSISFDKNDTPGEYTSQYFFNGKLIGENKYTIAK